MAQTNLNTQTDVTLWKFINKLGSSLLTFVEEKILQLCAQVRSTIFIVGDVMFLSYVEKCVSFHKQCK